MGYTHYFYNKKKTLATPKKWKEFTNDCQKIFQYCQSNLCIDLANGLSDENSQPEITDEHISFNGSEQQRLGVWTTDEQLSIPWPAEDAGLNDPIADPIAEKTSGHWFAGNLLKQRVAPRNEVNGLGSGSYETMWIDRVAEKDGQFNCCKTAFRPYDLAVTAVLVAAKHHFGNKITVRSDGNESHWMDGKILCNNILGYGMDFEFDDDDE